MTEQFYSLEDAEVILPTIAEDLDTISTDQIPIIDYEDGEIKEPQSVIDILNNPPLIQHQLKIIDEVNAYSWSRGELGGLDWGYECLNKAMEGLNTGVHIVAGESNVGKSAFLMQLAERISSCNKVLTERVTKKAFVLYFSLDDTNNELLPRMVAIDQRIKINAVRFPKKYEHNQDFMDKREAGFENLKNNVEFLAMRDSNEGSSIEHIKKISHEYIEWLEMKEPGVYTLVIMIDNFHDISVDAKGYSEDNARYDYIAGELTDLSNRLDAPVLCSAEFRKINGGKRPTREDIRSSGKIAYEAKAILLCHNDVGSKKEQAGVFWELDDQSHKDEEENEPVKMPVWEVDLDKNKFGSYKGRMYWRFVPEMSSFFEASDAENVKFTQMLTG